MRITCTNGNRRNGISGSRVSIYGWDGQLVDRFEVSARGGSWYCEQHPTGYYGRRYYAAMARAIELDRAVLRNAEEERAVRARIAGARF